MRSPADKMKGSIWSLAQSAVAFMANPVIAQSCRRGAGENFNVRDFIKARGTLYLVGSDKDDTIAPLLSALTRYIYDDAAAFATEQPHERLDPPFSLFLDEVTKITPVPLPSWSADARSHGLVITAATQTFDQLRERWGQAGAGTIESALGTLLVLGGLRNTDDLTKLSDLIGMRESRIVHEGESVHVSGRSTSKNVVVREERIMPVAQIRRLPRQHAEPADDLRELSGVDEGHRGDDRPVVPAQGQVQHLVDALPPAGQVLEVSAQAGREHAVQAEADVLGVAHDAASEPSVQFVGGLRLAAPKGPLIHSSMRQRSDRGWRPALSAAARTRPCRRGGPRVGRCGTAPPPGPPGLPLRSGRRCAWRRLRPCGPGRMTAIELHSQRHSRRICP
jgi:hypothetical protein